MNDKNIEIVVHKLGELGSCVYCVCTESKKPGQPRRERARFWNVTDLEKRKHYLMARINRIDFIVPENGKRDLSQEPYSEGELKLKAENYAKTMRENP